MLVQVILQPMHFERSPFFENVRPDGLMVRSFGFVVSDCDLDIHESVTSNEVGK